MNRRLEIEDLHVLKFTEKTIPTPPPGGAVIKTCYAGICHSDVHILRRPYGAGLVFPRVLGHEIAGTIYSLGDGVKEVRSDLRLGDKVAVFPWGFCQKCTNCRQELNFCTTMAFGAGPKDSYTYGVWRDGGYQQYVVVDLVKLLEKIPDGVEMDQAAILTCSGVTSMRAVGAIRESVERACKINGRALVAVVGTGALCLWGIQIIKATLPPEVVIVAVDISMDKLLDAEKAGANITHLWGVKEGSEEASADLMKAAGGHLDAIIDYTGIKNVIERAHLSLNLGATLCLVGIGGNELPSMTLNSVVRRNVTIRGVLVGSQPHCRQLMELVAQGKVRSPPITHVTLDDVPEVLEKLHKGTQLGRAVVKM